MSTKLLATLIVTLGVASTQAAAQALDGEYWEAKLSAKALLIAP